MRMHYHSWSFEDILDTLYHLVQSFILPQDVAQSRDFFFFLDPSNNGSSNFLGLNVSQRNVAYVSDSWPTFGKKRISVKIFFQDAVVKFFEWIGFVVTEHFFVTYIDTRGQ